MSPRAPMPDPSPTGVEPSETPPHDEPAAPPEA